MDKKGLKETLEVLEEELIDLAKNLKPFFANFSTYRTAKHYLKGLLSVVDRKNNWQIAEKEGFKTPYRLQHLLGRALWNADQVRDFHMQRVGEGLGFEQGSLIVDETGFLKKGKKSAGVARQYSGTAGRIDNCQIGVFLAWATKEGHTLIDRELYLPKEWAEDRARCKDAYVPEERSFLTKIELAQQMIEQALKKGFKPSWVVADEVYGKSYHFRIFLEQHHLSYVVAVPKTQSICQGFNKIPANNLLSSIHSDAWETLSCGEGSKGPRLYQWACLPLNSPNAIYQRWVLFRKGLKDSEDIAYFLVSAHPDISLEDMVRAAGQRWKIEECFESAKGEVGLDQYEVRSYQGWCRHITLAMLAHALLVKARSQLFPSLQGLSSMDAFKKKRGLL